MDAHNLDLEDPESGCVSQTKAYFEHADETNQLVQTIIHGDLAAASKALERISEILDIYQEQSHLLDPNLEALIEPVIAKLRKDVEKHQLSKDTTCHLAFRYLYLLTKTRGYKIIVKFMSHDVTDLESVFDFLASMDEKTVPWETRYVCFIWLSLICMIPFDLKRVDSSTEQTEGGSLITRMINLCKHYLKTTGKERDGASLLIARLLSRQDLYNDHLVPYIEWAKNRLENEADVFEAAGILGSLCATYKYADRNVLLPTLDNGIFPMLTMSFFDKFENNSHIRKLRIKLTQRIGLCYLKAKVASWRYQRGNRSLLQNMSTQSQQATPAHGLVSMQLDEDDDEDDVPESLEVVIDVLLNGLRDKDTIVRWSAAKGIGRITQRLPKDLAEDVIGSLLELFSENTLKNPVTGQLNLTEVSDSTWHGASLAVAELARRGLLLPDHLTEVVPWIVHGLKFDLKRGSHSIGAHVRDAACYVCWSFARAYAPEVLQPFVENIARHLVVVSVFDREVNIRRASSAAFQENVGRQGTFPRGIDIIQLADYFSVGNRNNAYLSVAVEIAKFEEYRYHLVDHLANITINHWDKSLRVLASKCLYRLVPLDPTYFIENTLPALVAPAVSTDISISHGSMLAIAEICLALGQCMKQDGTLAQQWQTKSDLIKSIGHIISNVPQRSWTTFGSEHVREAACHLIECLAIIDLLGNVSQELQSTTLQTWKNIVKSSLERKEESVQEHAVLAFDAVVSTYGIDKAELDEYLENISPERMKYGRRGYALALGTISYLSEERKHWLPAVLRQLCSVSRVPQDGLKNDAESKRNAVMSIKSILERLGDHLTTALSKEDMQLIHTTLHICLTDYSTDQRGDVGSWVRVASMECLQYFMLTLARLDMEKNSSFLQTADIDRTISALLKQSVERIDRVRASAGSVLTELLFAEKADGTPLLNVSDREELQKYITRDLSWVSPAELYPVITHILALPLYRYQLFTGLVSSAGGLTESLIRHSSSSLIEYMDSLPEDKTISPNIQELAQCLLDIFADYEKQDRVIIPLLDVIGLLYESGTLSKIHDVTIHSNILTCTRKESFKCRNIRKLLAATKVYVGLLSLQGTQVKTRALQQMLLYLVHAFPRVRMEVSDQLYTYLSVLDDEEMTEGTAEAEMIITTTDWAGPLDEIKVERDKLYSLLNIPKPVMKRG